MDLISNHNGISLKVLRERERLFVSIKMWVYGELFTKQTRRSICYEETVGDKISNLLVDLVEDFSLARF